MTPSFNSINVEEGNFDEIAKGNFSIPQSNNGPKNQAEASSSKTKDRQPVLAVEQLGPEYSSLQRRLKPMS